MPTEDLKVEGDERDYRLAANMSLVLVVLLMVACEVEAIVGLWFKSTSHSYGWSLYALPVFIAFPALFLLILRREVKRWVAHGKLASGLAARIMNSFGVALWIAYFCVLQLAELAFKAR